MRIPFLFALALALVAPCAFPQKPPAPTPRPPAGPPASSAPPGNGLPSSAPQSLESHRDLVTYLVGHIATNDATAIPNDMLVERVCKDKVRQQVYANLNGDFSMELGSRADTFVDASAEPDSPVDVSRNDPTMGIPRRDLTNCDVRASAPGFRARVVSLAQVTGFHGMDRIDVGTIIVQRTSKIEGTTLSATPYRAPNNARKAYEKGLDAQKGGKLDDARRHYETAIKLYPKYESAWYGLGTVFQKQNDIEAARNALIRATTINSKYMPAYLSLASIAFEAQNWTEVLEFTGHILEIDPVNHTTITGYVVDLDPWNFAEAYFFNAAANYSLGKFEDAEISALKAEHVDLRTQFPQLHLLLSKIYVLKKDYSNAVSQLQTYLELEPSAKDADELRDQLAQLEKLNDPATISKPSLIAPIGELPIADFGGDKFELLLTMNLLKPRTAPQEFGPCSLDEVLPRVSARAREFVDNVNRITATEVLELERKRRNGKREDTLHTKVHYVANIQIQDSRYLIVDEYREGSGALLGFIKAIGSPALVLVFHPIHVDEFNITCAGLGTWQGAPAYLLAFQQRSDRPNNMSNFRTETQVYSVSLKGSAWVDATTFQVIHLETDLLNPVPDLFLDFEHQSLDYAPVIFATRNVTLWLPQSVNISVHLGNKQFTARHIYSDYQLFVVDTGERISQPKDVSN